MGWLALGCEVEAPDGDLGGVSESLMNFSSTEKSAFFIENVRHGRN